MVGTSKAMAGNAESGDEGRMSRWRIAAWGIAVLILLLPLFAMRFTDEVNWTGGDFVFAGVLLFGSLAVYEITARTTSNTVYRTGVVVALAAAFLLTWINAAAGITDSEADLLYLGVPVVGIIGAFLARFQPLGMARALFATALIQALVGAIALVSGVIPAYNSTFEIVGLTGFFVVLWAGSAWLFRRAARKDAGRGVEPAT